MNGRVRPRIFPKLAKCSAGRADTCRSRRSSWHGSAAKTLLVVDFLEGLEYGEPIVANQIAPIECHWQWIADKHVPYVSGTLRVNVKVRFVRIAGVPNVAEPRARRNVVAGMHRDASVPHVCEQDMKLSSVAALQHHEIAGHVRVVDRRRRKIGQTFLDAHDHTLTRRINRIAENRVLRRIARREPGRTVPQLIERDNVNAVAQLRDTGGNARRSTASDARSPILCCRHWQCSSARI